jgi:hypothetical protein
MRGKAVGLIISDGVKVYGPPLLPDGMAAMETAGQKLRQRYLGPTADVPIFNVTQ